MKPLTSIVKSLCKKVVIGVALTAALTAPLAAQETKTSLTHQTIGTEEKDVPPIYRFEAFSMVIPSKQVNLNADLYVIWEGNSDYNLHGLRTQLLTNTNSPFNIGVTAQYTYHSAGGVSQEQGLILRASDFSKPIKYKVDVRSYFSDKNNMFFGFVKTNKFGIEILGVYNTQKESGFFRTNWDYNINKHLAIGTETKHLLSPKGAEGAYIGIRLKLTP